MNAPQHTFTEVAPTSDSYWLICPYCKHKHDDAWDFGLDEAPFAVDCEKCGKKFNARSETTIEYVGEPIG